ncbi:probable glutamate carboxypeptidase AMP1 isoform X1 [Morus notabilis]|uniref:probable glutamate carboxypeptidase AMP1 isoform X1 n=1 Tax=Morus notabilis TaxID=981085 RepID=UPI000CED04F6|nr:probable glutamate carboxypeptidase AMP1 isoform X1 [Morus notabilis]
MAQLWSKPPVPTAASTKPPRPLYTFLFIVILCILGFYTLHYAHSAPPLSTSQNALRLFLSAATNFTLSAYLRDLTLHPHLAGTKPSLRTTHYVLNHFTSLGLRAHAVAYDALLSYPTHSSLSAHFSNGTELVFPLSESTGSGSGNGNDAVVRPYHAYSPSGTARGAMAVFVNFGREEDYRALGGMGVNVSGCVVIARKGGGLPRAAVVERAALNGAVAVLLYTGGDRFRKGFERGTVMRGLGDPLSPGWAGVEGGEKLGLGDDEVSGRFPKIPSLPLSVDDAEVILESLGGAPTPSEWRDALDLKVDHVGPGPTLVDFDYQGEKKVVKIHNVFAVIKGLEEPERYVLLGNHRDAWTYGAVDPNSGTAALLDIARRFSLMMRSGWRPRRTIVLCSWDAEEFGMIGSTEWVEQNLVNLGSKAVAYLNVDCAVQGPGFFAGATPQLDNLLLEVIKKQFQVEDPDSEGETMYQKWASRNSENNIERLGRVDSDFAAFVQHAGVPSVDMYYGADFPTYHTAFDSYDWMINYGDPSFKRHVAVAGVWGLLALHLADDPILPFNYISYAEQLKRHKEVLSNLLGGLVSLSPLSTSIQDFASAAKEAEIETQKLREQETTSELVVLKKRALNDRLIFAERGFLDTDGLEGRRWFKHLIYGPSSDPESKLDFFPGIADAISRTTRMSLSQKKAIIQHEVWRVARAIQRATSALRGELT